MNLLYFYNVLLDISVNINFTYSSDTLIQLGTRVLVDFNNKQKIGFVWNEVNKDDINYDITRIKPIIRQYNNILPPCMIDMVNFASQYYHYPIGQTIFTAISTILRKTEECNLNNTTKQIKPPKLNLATIAKYNKTIALNEEQLKSINLIKQNFGKYFVSVLYGITGSGKTEVYLELISEILLQDKQVLVLVPEINLTPQLLARFQVRFPDVNMCVLNSTITPKRRLIAHEHTYNDQNKIIIGTRLSVFTPFYSLGLIIVDEEHDSSFKQNDGLRYNARDLAVYKAKYHNVPIILGSATPSLESLYNFKTNKYSLCKLTSRGVTNASLPQIKIINTKQEQNIDGLTTSVKNAIANNLTKKELSLVYINRRGYAPMISCYDCGWVGVCKNCSMNLVFHATNNQLICHHCDFRIKLNKTCPKCNGKYLQALGHGTQKIENKLRTMFPLANILRIDRDTMSTKTAWDNLYTAIHNNEVDILVGTQMLAKGHDFHNLTLVVGLDLDLALYSHDFRSTEDLFTQLMQVSGRAGRGDKPGTVILQTKHPEHDIYNFLSKQDFFGFANHLFQQRKLLGLPPYTYYVLIRASSPLIKTTLDFLTQVHQVLYQYRSKEIIVLHPVPSALQKINNRERGQLLIRSNNRILLHDMLNKATPDIFKIKHNNTLHWSIDIDPLEL